jgi:hypothetical protein
MSIHDYGDLSGIVFNVATNSLVTGHQRIKTLMKDPRAHTKLYEKFEQPDTKGTTGWGFVVIDGTDIRLPYREVSWTETTHDQAMVLANRAQGEFVLPLLATVTKKLADLGEEVVKKTGQRKDEIKTLLKSLDKPKDPEPVDVPDPISEPGVTYQLGAHKFEVGADLAHLKEADSIRSSYAALNGHEDDWAAYTPAIAYPATQTQSELPTNETPTPAI